MESKLFSIFDHKIGVFRRPFLMQYTGEALRAFSQFAQDKGCEIGKYPDEFSLWEHAKFDEEKGTILPYDAPINLGSAIQFVKQEEI